MREGFEFIDTDHHVGPNMETLNKYASPALLDRWDELLPYYMKVTEGHHLSVAPIPYRRDLYTGTDEQQTAVGDRGAQGPLGSAVKLNFDIKPVPEVNNENNSGRLDDMDTEGVDIALIFPSTFSTASTALDPDIQTELYAAYHRYLDDYCVLDTDRLKAALVLNARDPEWSVAELEALADRPWVAAVSVMLPEGLPVDDPTLDGIWAAMNHHDLP
ncbi:MAG: hypothetical protein OXC06_08850, partial [Acidimicrobiaceae bacterium]|nr:hypothetical protein [Acidimicrobiaceae bacterium]